MVCYECQQAGKSSDAVALCHHCSAALCPEHALVFSDPVTTQYPVCKTVVLPLRARLFLCGTCRDALRQKFDNDREEATAPSVTATVQEEHAVSA
jgi:hypothetical protein